MDININHNIRFCTDSPLEHLLNRIITLLNEAQHERNEIMATLQDIQADEQQEASAIQQLSVLIDDLRAKVAAIGGFTAEQQAQIDAAFAAAEANKAALANLLTPASPAPAPVVAEPAPAATDAPAAA